MFVRTPKNESSIAMVNYKDQWNLLDWYIHFLDFPGYS